MQRKKISLIGCRGSVGSQALDVIRRHPESFQIVSLVSAKRDARLIALGDEFHADYVAGAEDENVMDVACPDEADIVFNAAPGFSGVRYSFEAARRGKALALANKETLVCAGELFSGYTPNIIPVDSEHSAIWQCLGFRSRPRTPVSRLVLTASGGPFAGKKYSDLCSVTPAEALIHPTWKMGKKITVDSATMMNKGYETIEAHFLFGVPYENIETVLQKKSLVHSLVEFEDGAVLAQMGFPAMEIPIQLALTYPERLETAAPRLDFSAPLDLSTEPLEKKDWPLYALALECGRAGDNLPCAMNAGDEVAVEAFLDGKISFTDIFEVVDGTVQKTEKRKLSDLESVEEEDGRARRLADEIVKKLSR